MDNFCGGFSELLIIRATADPRLENSLPVRCMWDKVKCRIHGVVWLKEPPYDHGPARGKTMWSVGADPCGSHWFLLITILFGNLNANDTFNCKTRWMWFDLWEAITFMLCLAPNFQKADNNCFADLTFFLIFFFPHKKRKEQNKNETNRLLFVFFDKFIKNYFCRWGWGEVLPF